jgi:hypothetical protein
MFDILEEPSSVDLESGFKKIIPPSFHFRNLFEEDAFQSRKAYSLNSRAKLPPLKKRNNYNLKITNIFDKSSISKEDLK